MLCFMQIPLEIEFGVTMYPKNGVHLGVVSRK